jgi:hypothetical protein
MRSHVVLLRRKAENSAISTASARQALAAVDEAMRQGWIVKSIRRGQETIDEVRLRREAGDEMPV